MLKLISVPTAILLLSVLLLSGCGEFPPDEDEAREQFEDSREMLKELEVRLAGTKYGTVKVSGLKMAEGSYKVDRFTKRESLEDGAEWNELMIDADINSVSRNEGAYFFSFGGDPFEDEISGEMKFMHQTGAATELKQCESDFEEARCGRCVVELEDDWWIYYDWFPDSVAPDATKAYADGAMTDNEYWVTLGNALDACVKEGNVLLGYETAPPAED